MSDGSTGMRCAGNERRSERAACSSARQRRREPARGASWLGCARIARGPTVGASCIALLNYSRSAGSVLGVLDRLRRRCWRRLRMNPATDGARPRRQRAALPPLCAVPSGGAYSRQADLLHLTGIPFTALDARRAKRLAIRSCRVSQCRRPRDRWSCRLRTSQGLAQPGKGARCRTRCRSIPECRAARAGRAALSTDFPRDRDHERQCVLRDVPK
jgi:hypothetical protein